MGPATIPIEKSKQEIRYVIKPSGFPEYKDTQNAIIKPTLEIGSRGVLMDRANMPTQNRKKIN